MNALSIRSARNAGLFLILTAACLTGCAKAVQSTDAWITVYQDDYNYARSVDKFNTWFWREDSVGTHTWNVTNAPVGNCTGATPCVKLTAQRDPQAVDYINAEMYNNSCAAEPIRTGGDDLGLHCAATSSCLAVSAPGASGALNSVGDWHGYPPACYACYAHYCSNPYPYRSVMQPNPAPAGVTDSWNTGATGAVSLWKNPLYTIDKEPNWQWFRDLVFNVPYRAAPGLAQKITMGIAAEGQGGGSRGWGYWNTTFDPASIQMAWFMEVSSQNASGGDVQSSVWLMTVGVAPGGGQPGVCVSLLDPSINVYQYRTYTIDWRTNAVTYYVDGQVVAQHTAYVPNRGLSFHNWADNRNYLSTTPANFPLFTAKANYINAYTVQTATNPPPLPASSGATAPCISFAQLEKYAEDNLIRAIIAWLIAEGFMPGPVIPPAASGG